MPGSENVTIIVSQKPNLHFVQSTFKICFQIDGKSLAQGFTESRLPEFTAEESQEILGSADFLGLNL